MQKDVLNRLTYWAMLLCVVAFCVNLGVAPVSPAEQRTIEAASEMANSGHWLLPMVHGESQTVTPPLSVWIAACMAHIAPNSLTALRIVPAFMACLFAWFLCLTANYLTRNRLFAIVSMMVCITTLNVVQWGRMATPDIYCHSFMMIGIYYLLRGLYDRQSQSRPWRWLPTAGIFMGLSIFSQDLTSTYALLLPAVLAILAADRPFMRGKWAPLGIMLLLCMIIGGWWHIYMHIASPEVIQTVTIVETDIAQAANNASAEVDTENAPDIARQHGRLWRYVQLFLSMGVWGVFALASFLAFHWRRYITDKSYSVCLLWMIASLVVLFVMPTESAQSLLPQAVPCSLCVSHVLCSLQESRPADWFSRHFFRTTAGLSAILVLCIPIIFVYMNHTQGAGISIFAIIMGSLMALFISFWIFNTARQFRPVQFVFAIGMLCCIFECFFMNKIIYPSKAVYEETTEQIVPNNEADNTPEPKPAQKQKVKQESKQEQDTTAPALKRKQRAMP